jgi:hypothetical protein
MAALKVAADLVTGQIREAWERGEDPGGSASTFERKGGLDDQDVA